MEGRDAAALLGVFAEGERICAAAKTVLAGRVEDANAWQRDGHKSAAHWLAATTGDTLGSAIGTIETAKNLTGLSETSGQFRTGQLSAAQARVIGDAATADPTAEADLLTRAKTDTIASLQDHARRVKAAAIDQAERERRIHDTRYLRTWIDADGAGCGQWRLPAAEHARILAALAPVQRDLFNQARKQGRQEHSDAYTADALIDLLTRDTASSPNSKGPEATVHVLIDLDALTRGSTEPGETCEIAGVGPISVNTARRLLGDSFLKLLVKHGIDITTVAHCGRTVPAPLRSYLEVRDPCCVVPGCGAKHNLEIDHVFVAYADGGPLSATNAARLCPWHHYLKTHCGYRLAGGPGHWQWIAPGSGGDDDDRGPPATGPPNQHDITEMQTALQASLDAALAGP